jgi:hypothetical protein
MTCPVSGRAEPVVEPAEWLAAYRALIAALPSRWANPLEEGHEVRRQERLGQERVATGSARSLPVGRQDARAHHDDVRPSGPSRRG